MGEVTQRMLMAADLKPGMHVLDIAAGTGDQSRMAAQLVGSDGAVLATDISAEMLKVTAQLAQQEGLSNITTRVMDAAQLDLPAQHFDAVISRLGLMLVPERQRALTEIRRVLKPGGKLAALVWSTPELNPLFAVPMATIAKYTGDPFPSIPGPFALADPATFEQALKDAGLRAVTVEAVTLQFRFPSLGVFLQGRRNMAAGAIDSLSPSDRQHLMEDIQQALQPFEGPQGLAAAGEMLLGVGLR
jgi:ubiquinone/menaquinone biosynthesis C-methylase UbiE